jgi:tRNA 2-thiouridine synthesizing protein A
MEEDVPEVDARGLQCPLPLLKAKKALNALPPGGLLRVFATDTGSVRDFRVFCEQSGTVLVESAETGGVFSYLLRKREN